jgi:DnaJ-class molecular chaperone
VPVYKKEGNLATCIFTYNVQLPTNLSAKQRELFEELANPKKKFKPMKTLNLITVPIFAFTTMWNTPL